MVNVCQCPGVIAMPIDCFFQLTCVVFEWVSSACSFSCQRLFIQRFMSLRLQVKGPLTDWLKNLFLTTFEIFSVGSPLWRAFYSIVMSFEHLMDQCNGLRHNLSVPSTLVVAGKQSDK